jgi:hypothetical protein
MQRSSLFTPLLFIFVSIAFLTISVLVILSKGKNGRLIKSKLRLGAFLLGITAVSTGCPPVVSCYDPVDNNEYLYLNDTCLTNGKIEADFHTLKTLTGKIYNRNSSDFSFLIIDNQSNILQRDSITPIDGNFDNSIEDIFFTVSDSIPAGNHNLLIYNNKPDLQSNPMVSYNVIIK